MNDTKSNTHVLSHFTFSDQHVHTTEVGVGTFDLHAIFISNI